MTQQQQQQQQPQPKTVSDFERLLARESRAVEYVPFGASDPIRLTIKIVQDVIAVPTRTGRTCTERDAIKFIMMCHSQRLNPFAGDAYLVGYDKKQFDGSYAPQFSLITSYFAFLRRAEISPDYNGMQSGIVLLNEDGSITERETEFCLPAEKCVGGWAKVYRKSRQFPDYSRLAISAMRPGYETPFWSDDKAPGQIEKCAQADALRKAYPTVLGGLYVDGEMSGAIDRLVPDGRRSLDHQPGKNLVEVEAVKSQPPAAPAAEQPADDDGGLGPQAESQAAPSKPELEPDPRDQLRSFVVQAGCSFDDLKKWGITSGAIPNADSLPGFEAVPTDIARRLLRAKTGLARGLMAAKEGQ